jgi:hypothetical protein
MPSGASDFMPGGSNTLAATPETVFQVLFTLSEPPEIVFQMLFTLSGTPDSLF